MGKRLIAPKVTEGEWDWWDMDEFGFHVFALKFGSREKGQDCRVSLAAVRCGRSHHETSENFFEGQANARFLAGSKRLGEAAAALINTTDENGFVSKAHVNTLRTALLSAGYEEEKS